MSLEQIALSSRKYRKRIAKIVVYTIIGRGLKILIIGIAFADSTWSMTIRDMITDLVSQQSSSLLPSSKYIDVHYSNISTGSSDYPLMQQAIFLGILPNTTQSLNLSRNLTRGYARRFLNTNLSAGITDSKHGNQKITHTQRQEMLSQAHIKTNNTVNISIDHSNTIDLPVQSSLNPIFHDVYDRLKHEFVWSGTNEISDDILIQWAIKGMTQAAGDTHTVYLAPKESKNFSDSIQGEFFGIGAYIDTKEPWILMVSSAIADSPAAKAGIKAWDRITAIDDYIVTKETNPDEAISKIKWPKGTSVILTILRWWETKTITIVRDKIIVKPITTTWLNDNTVLVSINSFSFGIDTIWTKTMDDIMSKWYQRIVIDLRYNPGGSLDDVTHMLDSVVPKGEPTVIIRSRDSKEVYTSNGVEPSKSLATKKVIVLINKESASASEILAWVIRDYLPDAQIVGEKSYGKWSVQTLWDYNDGSSLKITTAKWYTGKSDTTIDKKGILPDTVVVDDQKTETDEVLDRVKSH